MAHHNSYFHMFREQTITCYPRLVRVTVVQTLPGVSISTLQNVPAGVTRPRMSNRRSFETPIFLIYRAILKRAVGRFRIMDQHVIPYF